MDNSNYYNNQPQMMDDGALDWDSAVEEQAFVPLKPGKYPFIVTSYERGRYNGGQKMGPCPKATINFTVRAGGEVGDRQMSKDLFLHKKTQGFLFDFFRSIGSVAANGQILMDWNRVQGAQGYVEIYDRTYTKKDGTPGTAADVKRFIDPAELKAPTTTNQGWTPGGF